MSTTQQYINVGEVANDGTGESLRNAFTAVNNNFSNIWAQGPVDSQVVISNNQISTNVTNLPLVLAGNGIGTITVDSTVVPNIDAVYDLGSPTQRFDEVHARYYYGNGRFLTGISGGGGGGGNVTFSTDAPVNPAIGDIWIESDTGVQYIYFNDDTSSQWAEMEAYLSFSTSSGNGGNGNVDFNSIQSNVTPYASATFTLGTPASQWLNAYISNAVSLNNVSLTASGGRLYVNGLPVITSSSNVTYYNLSVTSNVSAGNNISAGNSVYANGYYYSNGVSIFNTAYPGSDIILRANIVTTARLNQNLVLSANGTGNIQTDSTLVPNLDGFYDIGAPTNRYNTIFAEYFVGNGALLTGIAATANTGNWAFNANTMYNINGGSINNSDLTHGTTATLTIPANGNTSPFTILNYYGNFVVTSGNAPSYTKTLTFDYTGNLTVPETVTAGNLKATGNIYIGNTVFTRTLTVGRAVTPVTVPLASNNSFNVLTVGSGNVVVYTT